ncbi:MAG: ATP-grasp domain-containing protein [Chloracidobacterium sp.]|nr:ATP-grasp domain-containing protein [Chloracidobacterium sp.]MDW8217816.1 ATP-grasp domain-containing protein [Acidobacteriota bacterium]
MPTRPPTMLCLASYEKGAEFMREAKRQGWRVYLVTSESIRDADWPRESLDDIFFMPDENKKWRLNDVILGVSYLARTHRIDRIVALDDFDVETAAALREHLRVPGMGETTARYFRDKLAMRAKAREHGVPVPPFTPVFNDEVVNEYLAEVPGPWLVKPRSEASTIGIKRTASPEEVWATLHQLGDRRSFHLLEKFIPGEVYHVDSIVSEREVVFAAVSKYARPPIEVMHDGDVFATRIVEYGSDDEQELLELNRRVLWAMGLVRGASHTEFIKAHEDGAFYFLETSARVGGANIVELVEAATGVNLWAEWAKLECAVPPERYRPPQARRDYAGLLISLARQQRPDTSAYNDPEIVWRLNKEFHAGLIVQSPSYDRITRLLDDYVARFRVDFFARQPVPERPTT